MFYSLPTIHCIHFAHLTPNVVGNSGGWVLEQGDVDLIGRYFKAAIVKSKLVLFLGNGLSEANIKTTIINTFTKEQLLKLTKEQINILTESDISKILKRFTNTSDISQITEYFKTVMNINAQDPSQVKLLKTLRKNK